MIVNLSTALAVPLHRVSLLLPAGRRDCELATTSPEMWALSGAAAMFEASLGDF